MNAQEIIQKIRDHGKPLDAKETRKILDAIQSEARSELDAVLAGVLMHQKARALAEEIEATMDGAEATAKTAAIRFNELHQAVEKADLALRQAKADKIMLPRSTPEAELAKADRRIQKAERALQTANSNLRAAQTFAEVRQRELDGLRAMHRALEEVTMPDLTPLRALLDAVGRSPR